MRSIEQIPDEIERLAANGVEPGRNWTLAQITEHLARTIDVTLARVHVEMAVPPIRSKLLRAVAREFTLLTGWIPANLPTASELTSAPGIDLQAALRHLRGSIQELVAAPEPLPDHPFLGPMSRRKWRRFHAVHAYHHLHRVRRHDAP